MSVLIDTGVLVDYLRGDARAARAIEAHAHRAISVLTWLETMTLAPPQQQAPTLAFLRSFERLPISEAVADEALRLREANPALELHCALNWATARAHRLTFVSSVDQGLPAVDPGISRPYRGAGAAAGVAGR